MAKRKITLHNQALYVYLRSSRDVKDWIGLPQKAGVALLHRSEWYFDPVIET